MRSILKGSILAGLTALCLAQPASAALEMYVNQNYGGLMGTRNTQGWWNMAPVNNDQMSSFKNLTRYNVTFWHDADRTGPSFTDPPGRQSPGLRSFDDDETTSYQLL